MAGGPDWGTSCLRLGGGMHAAVAVVYRSGSISRPCAGLWRRGGFHVCVCVCVAWVAGCVLDLLASFAVLPRLATFILVAHRPCAGSDTRLDQVD